MPAQLIPYVPQRVYYLHVQGIYSNDEFFALDYECLQLVEQSPLPLLHFILDYRQTTQLPSLSVQNKSHMGRHPKLGWVVVVEQGNKITQFLTTIMAGVFKAQLRYFATFEEAIAFLQQVDSTLPDLYAPEYRQNISAYIPFNTSNS